jgi:hypothetical protein
MQKAWSTLASFNFLATAGIGAAKWNRQWNYGCLLVALGGGACLEKNLSLIMKQFTVASRIISMVLRAAMNLGANKSNGFAYSPPRARAGR